MTGPILHGCLAEPLKSPIMGSQSQIHTPAITNQVEIKITIDADATIAWLRDLIDVLGKAPK